MTVDDVAALFRGFRFRFQNERELQDAIESVLTRAGAAHAREVDLGVGDRIDFVVEPGIGIEVKIDGSTSEVTRQVHRYLQAPELAALVVVTSRMRHALQLPREFNGKPLRALALTGGLL
jgi:ethanolamine utilization microcompartment shell protein EutL